MPLDIAMTNEEKVLVTLRPTTASGATASLDGAPTLTVQGPGDATVESVDDLNFWVISGNPGTTSILVEADADLDDGVVTISDVVNATVEGAQAANVGLNSAPPVPK